MTKHVFNTQECAHRWAAQSQDSGSNSSESVSFTGKVFYSYRTAIAQILKSAQTGTDVVLIDSSNSHSRKARSKHVTAVRRAVMHMTTFTVPFVTVAHESIAEWNRIHAANVAYLGSQQLQFEGKARRCPHDVLVDYYCDRIRCARATLYDYIRTFDVGTISGTPADEIIAAILRERAEKKAKRETPAYLARKAARIAERERIAALPLSERIALNIALNNAKFGAKLQAQHDRALKDQEERERIAARARENWIAGNGPLSGMYFWKENGSAYCRWNPERMQSETSQGAVVDHAQTLQALEFIADYVETLRERNSPRHDFGPMHRVGPYTLRTVFANGDVQIGCHFIDREELNKVRAALGLPLVVQS
jgi:hypothetical protein